MTGATFNGLLAGTHNGIFHADDVFAGAILVKRSDWVEFIRTRDPEKLAEADIRFDVGNRYDPATLDFDHHQRGRAGERPNGIPFASAGLVWKEYGIEICGSQEVADEVDRILIQQIDALDNGLILWKEETVPGVSPWVMNDLINTFNPTWEEEPDFDARYERAVYFARDILERTITTAQSNVRAVEAVREAIAQAKDPRVIMLPKFIPWEETIVTEAPQALFVVYPSQDQWNTQCVPTAVRQMDQRLPFPAEWAGLRGHELVEATGVSDAVFAHTVRFFCAAKSEEGALELTYLALGDDPDEFWD